MHSYSTHGSREKLASLNAKSLAPLVPDKEQRKTVVAALKGLLSGDVRPAYIRTVFGRLMASSQAPAKRKRGPDFTLPGAVDSSTLSLDFELVTDLEVRPLNSRARLPLADEPRN